MEMSEAEGAAEQSPTDSLNRPTKLIPPDSPIRFQEVCNGKKCSSSADAVSPGEEKPSFGDPQPQPGSESAVKEDSFSGVNGSSHPECLTPTLEDCALSEMLVKVANKDKHYIGGEMIHQPVNLVGQTPTPDECLSPFWTKQFHGLGENVCKDEPGGEKRKAGSPSTAGTKKSPVTVSIAGERNRIFVINNARVVEDGACLGRLKSSPAGATVGAKDNHTGLRYYHQGMVMELIPGQTPCMKAVDAEHPGDCIDCGSSMIELIKKPKVISPVENCWVESGFCAYLVLRYTDPENPQLEAMNSPTLHKTLKDLESKGRTPSDEGFTPLVNIARESSTSSQDDYTTALFFTTEKYTYYIYVENQNLVLKKYKTGDGSSEAKPQNNKQFLDKRYPDSCSTCGQPKGKEEVDGEGAKRVEKMSVDSFDAEDSAESSSNPRSSGANSQLSSPEGSSISPSKSKLLQAKEKPDASNESETMDSGVEAN